VADPARKRAVEPLLGEVPVAVLVAVDVVMATAAAAALKRAAGGSG